MKQIVNILKRPFSYLKKLDVFIFNLTENVNEGHSYAIIKGTFERTVN